MSEAETKEELGKLNDRLIRLTDLLTGCIERQCRLIDRQLVTDSQIRELEAHLRTVDPGWRGLE